MSHYIGEPVNRCMPCPYDFHSVDVVVVSGDGINPCGHMLLRVGAWYFHVDKVHGYPLQMDAEGYARFMAESKKVEVRRTHVLVAKPQAAHAELERVLSSKWWWKVLPDNCATFVEVVLTAGGNGRDSLYTNCPTLEPWGYRVPKPALRRGP